MLPQMMPLPWLIVFSFIFVVYFSVNLSYSYLMFLKFVNSKSMKKISSKIYW